MIDLQASLGSNFIWIDHHKTAIEECEKVGLKINGCQTFDNKHAACVQTWIWLYGKTDYLEIPTFIRLEFNKHRLAFNFTRLVLVYNKWKYLFV